MKKYYVMSIFQEKNVLDSIRGKGIYLFDSLNNFNDISNIIPLSSYICKKSETLYLSTIYFKKYNFSIRSIIDMHIVSKEFYDLIECFNIDVVEKYKLVVVDSKDLDKKIIDKYFLIKLSEVGFNMVLDIESSLFSQEYVDTIDEVLKLKIKSKINKDLFIIKELGGEFKTPICSQNFKDNYEKKEMKGVKFYDIDTAPWLSGCPIEYYLAEQTTGEKTEFIDPI